MLDFGGMLCRTMHRNIAIFAGKSQRCLPLEIEMFLTADFHPAGDMMRCSRDRTVGVAIFHGRRRPKP